MEDYQSFNFRLTKIKVFGFTKLFFPRPKVISMVIHFKYYKNTIFKIKDISNLEKVTRILFSNKRKMINKSIRKILNDKKLKRLPDLNLNLRPDSIKPDLFYKITEIYER